MTHAVLVSVALAGVSLGCGSGGGGINATCASNASCGGDVVGTWTIVRACNTTASMPPGCGAETYTVTDTAQTGTLAFRADGTVTEMIRTTGTFTLMSPPECLASSMETCADVDASYKDLVRTGSSYTAANCADNAGTCVCTLMFDTTSDIAGTYTTSGSTVTITSSGNAVASYCVTGSTMVLSAPRTTGDPAVYVLTRQ